MTVTAQAPSAPQASSLASSTTFRTFALVFAIAAPIIYVICEMRNWPIFTYFPATGRLTWGWAPPTQDEGPAMHWYGWTAVTMLGSGLLGLLATALPQGVARRIPLWLTWFIPLLSVPILVYGRRFYWRW